MNFIYNNADVIAIIIAISWLIIEVLKQIWDMSEKVKLLLAIIVSVVISYGAYLLNFIKDVSLNEFIILVLLQILGLGVVYDKFLKPVVNPILNLIFRMFR